MPKMKYGMYGLNKVGAKSINIMGMGDGELPVTKAGMVSYPKTMMGMDNDRAFNLGKQYGTPTGMDEFDRQFMSKKKMNYNMMIR